MPNVVLMLYFFKWACLLVTIILWSIVAQWQIYGDLGGVSV